MELSIVIVTWNSVDFTRQCLESLQGTAGNLGKEIIVVDNASTDGTAEYIEHSFPDVRVIRNQANEGFARGNNLGIRVSRGDYLVLLNSDVIVPPDCLLRLHTFMERNRDIGIAGPAMFGPKGERRRSCMRLPTVWNSLSRAVALDVVFRRCSCLRSLLMGDFEHDRLMDVEVLNGWFWIVRRTAFKAVGELDERFFMYGEDLDWCYRFRSAKWRVVFYPGAAAVHYGGGSSGKAPIRYFLEMQKANAQFWAKHHGRLANAGYRATQWVHQCLRLAGYALCYVASGASRETSGYKVRRSVECLRWLATSGTRRECGAR